VSAAAKAVPVRAIIRTRVRLSGCLVLMQQLMGQIVCPTRHDAQQ
jgi:hypothetical protein